MIFLKTLVVFGQLWLAEAGPTYTVSLPDFIHVFVGSCALVPCVFNISDFEEKLEEYESLHAFWIKGGSQFSNTENPVVFNGTTNATQLFERVEVIGDLRRRNCSTVFYNVNKSHQDKYFFRAETAAFKATFINMNFVLSVADSPASPYVSGPAEVAEGSSLTLSCSAADPCPYHPPTITWSHHAGNITTHTQHQEDGRRNLTSLLTFTASRSHHGREVFCRASYSRQNQSTVEANRTAWRLNVLFPPEVVEVSVSPSGAVAEGSSVTLSCNSSEANPPVHNYTWFRDAQTSSPVDSGPNIILNISSNNAGIYYCRAEHPQGAKESDKVVVRLYTPPENSKTTQFIVIGAIAGSLALLFIAALSLAISRKKSTTFQEEDRSECETSATCDGDRPSQAQDLHRCRTTEEDEAEEIHYGEIDFSKRSLGDSNVRSDLGQEDTEYAEVRLSGRDAQTAGQTDTDARDSEMEDTDMGELYAKVQK